jgi:hypothetical protein
MSYQPIENYGVIGNLHTVAVVGMDRSLRRRCTPRTSKAAERNLFLVVVSRSWALTVRSRNVRQVPVSCISLRAVGYTLVTPPRWGSDSSRCQI